jgi:hypothetical protein
MQKWGARAGKADRALARETQQGSPPFGLRSLVRRQGAKSFRQFFVTFEDRRVLIRVSRCSMGIDFSGEIGESRLFIGLCHVFGMQGSLVQIQSSRPQIHKEVRKIALQGTS